MAYHHLLLASPLAERAAMLPTVAWAPSGQALPRICQQVPDHHPPAVGIVLRWLHLRYPCNGDHENWSQARARVQRTLIQMKYPIHLHTLKTEAAAALLEAAHRVTRGKNALAHSISRFVRPPRCINHHALNGTW